MSNNDTKVNKENLTLVDADELLNGNGSNNASASSPTGTGGLKPLTEEPSEKDLEDYRAEYAKIQDDINTLRLVLNEKLKREQELKTLLGVSFVDELKHDFQESFNSIKQSNVYQKAAQTLTDLGTTVTQNDAYQKTSAGIKTASQKITPTFQTIGTSFRSRIGDMRNSAMFKSVEGTFSNVTSKIKGSKSEYGIDENLLNNQSNNNINNNVNGAGGSSTLPKAKTQDTISANDSDKKL